MESGPTANPGSHEPPRVAGLLRALALYAEARGRLQTAPAEAPDTDQHQLPLETA